MVGGAQDGDDVMNAIREEEQVKEVNMECNSDCKSVNLKGVRPSILQPEKGD